MSPIAFQACRLRQEEQDLFRIDPLDPGLEIEADARELHLSQGAYEHRLVALADAGYERDERFIAAFPQPPGSGPPLLELDERGNPIPGSERSLQALEIAEALLASESPDPDQARERLCEIHGLLGADDARLSELLFERLYEWALAVGQDKQLPQVFWLLPWGDLLAHMNRLDLLLARDKQSYPEPDAALAEELPELTHLFRSLAAGFGPALRELTEWRDPGAPITPRLVWALSRRLQRISGDQIPPEAQGPFTEAVEAVGRWAHVKLWSFSSPRNHVLTAQVMVDVYEFLLRLDAPFGGSRENGRVKWMGRIAVAAQAAGYPGGRLRLRQATADLLSDAAGDPPPDLGGEMIPIEAEAEADRFFDRAFVLYFGAVVALRVKREPELAFARAREARRAFERFALNPLPFRSTRLANILPRTCLVEFECAFAHGDYEAATEALIRTLGVLERADRLSQATADLLRAELLLKARALCEEDAQASRRLAPELGAENGEQLLEAALMMAKGVFQESLGNRKAWKIYFENAETDAAIEEIETALSAERDEADLDELERETLPWLEYQLASLMRQRAEDVPEATLEAFSLYVKLLASRQFDLAVLEEILEVHSELGSWQAEPATELLAEHLVPATDPDSPLTHAALRWALLGESAEREEIAGASQALPIIGAGAASQATIAEAEEVLVEEIRKSRFVARVLELVSKWLYDEARAVGDRSRLRAVGRLLKPATRALPHDPVWWTRRADIAITERDEAASRLLMEEIPAFLREDPIAHFQRARLLLTMGNLADADEELIHAAFLDRETTGEELPNAAILDRRGFIALRESRYDDAVGLYQSILAENGADPNAHYGLGRVYLESPHCSTEMVLSEWRKVLRLQSPASSSSQHFAWRAAAGIAGLVHHQVSTAPETGPASRLLSELHELVTVEDPSSSRHVINALRVRGVIDPHSAEIVRQVSSHGLSRSVAQYLMARAIHVYVEEPEKWGDFVSRELHADVIRCRQQGVLGDFLAGAKGSYGRAQIRVGIQRKRVAERETSLPEPVGAKKLRKLIEHVVTTDRSASYYRDAYRYIRAVEKASDEQLVSAACEIIARMAAKVGEGAGRGPSDDLPSSLRPHIGLEPIGEFLGLKETRHLTGYVDVDALLYAKATKQLEDWHLSGTALTSRKPVDVSIEARRSYARAGLDWASENGHGHHCYVNLIHPGTESPTRADEAAADVLPAFA